MNIIKRIVAVLLSVVILFVISSCTNGNGNNNSQVSESGEKITAKEIINMIIESDIDNNLDSTAFYGDDLYKENCIKLYDIDFSDIEDGGIIYSKSGGFADEISIIKTNDRYSGDMIQILESRVEKRKQDFAGYKPTEISKIEKSKVFSCGDFYVLIISDNSEELEKLIKSIAEEQ
ncbi:MAG: DUF4358 domain-containing protein [Oscillospiraceae bacterium]